MSKAKVTCGIDTGILLEAGTNELEILVIGVNGCQYGVNVAKVREVLKYDAPTRLPHTHPAVEGSVRIRDEVLPVIDLAKALGMGRDRADTDGDRLIVMEFNEERISFHVNAVDQIHRVSWNSVIPMPTVGNNRVPVTGIIKVKGCLVQMLDFEYLGAMVGMNRRNASPDAGDLPQASAVADLPIVFADDSIMIREMLQDALQEAGFTNLQSFTDGAEAWRYLAEVASTTEAKEVRRKVAAVITDVEMPQMDGLHLTRRIREDAKLRDVPVILFSSIVSRNNEKKGQQVGANAQVAKPHYAELARTLVEMLENTTAA